MPTAPVAVRSLPQQRRSRIQQHVAVPLGGPSCPRTTKCAGGPDGHYAALLPVNVALQRAGAVRASVQVLPQRRVALREGVVVLNEINSAPPLPPSTTTTTTTITTATATAAPAPVSPFALVCAPCSPVTHVPPAAVSPLALVRAPAPVSLKFT